MVLKAPRLVSRQWWVRRTVGLCKGNKLLIGTLLGPGTGLRFNRAWSIALVNGLINSKSFRRNIVDI